VSDTLHESREDNGRKTQMPIGFSAWQQQCTNPPEFLYHYTDAQGLLGILSSGRLWATNVRFMNDPSEITYAVDLIRGVIEKMKQEVAPPIGSDLKPLTDLDAWDAHLERVGNSFPLDYLKSALEAALKMFEIGIGEAYVISFCVKDNLLSQWRGYGKDGGYSIGFRATELRCRGGDNVILKKVIYEPGDQRQITADWISDFLKGFQMHSVDSTNASAADLGNDSDGVSYAERQMRAVARLQRRADETDSKWRELGDRIIGSLLELIPSFKNFAYGG